MQETNGPLYQIKLGGSWLVFFLLINSLAVRELISFFGAGFMLHPAIGIASGSITSYFLVTSFILGRSLRVHFPAFQLTDSDIKSKSEVADALQALPSDCFYFNDLSFRETSVDHLILSGKGCLVIHTRGLLGKITFRNNCLLIDGKRADALLAECWNQAYFIRELLERGIHERIQVLPVLCLPRIDMPELITVKGVHIVNTRLLPQVLSLCNEAIEKSLFFIISGFFAKKAGARVQKAGYNHEPVGLRGSSRGK